MYAIPGTNHARIQEEVSLDQARQHTYVRTIVQHLNDSNAQACSSTSSAYTTASPSQSYIGGLSCEPYYFIVDIDSVPYVIYTGANCIVVNVARSLDSLHC